MAGGLKGYIAAFADVQTSMVDTLYGLVTFSGHRKTDGCWTIAGPDTTLQIARKLRVQKTFDLLTATKLFKQHILKP